MNEPGDFPSMETLRALDGRNCVMLAEQEHALVDRVCAESRRYGVELVIGDEPSAQVLPGVPSKEAKAILLRANARVRVNFTKTFREGPKVDRRLTLSLMELED